MHCTESKSEAFFRKRWNAKTAKGLAMGPPITRIQEKLGNSRQTTLLPMTANELISNGLLLTFGVGLFEGW